VNKPTANPLRGLSVGLSFSFGRLQEGMPMPSLSFDPMAHAYDATRTYDEASFAAALAHLLERFPPHAFPRVLEPGIGTGRIALPLAQQGYEVWGIDISVQMLAILRQRLTQPGYPVRMTLHRADACHLPFRAEAFDLGLAVHLFYFISAWRQAVQELLRVVRADGSLVLMHTGMGKEIPWINERYKALCAAQGFPIPPMGVQSTNEVIAYCRALGCAVESIRDRWPWTSQIPLGEALTDVRAQAYSFTTMVPPHIHAEAVRQLEGEVRARYGSVTRTVEVPNQISFVFVRKR
jgi:ubiquinone/menaquinone biosynthesis C-methylase UbiE